MQNEHNNFLIVTASIGAGHNRAAQAIAAEIKAENPTAKIHIVDFMSTKTAYLNNMLKLIYLKMLMLLPTMYELLYNWSGGNIKGASIKRLLAVAMRKDMEGLIKRYQAKTVICTHPFPCAAASYLKRKKTCDFLLAGVITDFAIHQLWIYKQVDLYFVANAELKQELVEKGIEVGAINVTGIPIAPSFNVVQDKEKIGLKLGLDLNKHIILIMGGGLGMGGVKDTLQSLEQLAEEIQILVVAGENDCLQDSLQKFALKSRHHIKIWGYSDNIQELMAVAQLLISKPGALTISEALAMELPMILCEPIPGQEKENAQFVETKGAAVWVKNKKDIPEVVAEYLKNKQTLLKMRSRAKEYKKPLAAKEIINIIFKKINSKINNVVEL